MKTFQPQNLDIEHMKRKLMVHRFRKYKNLNFHKNLKVVQFVLIENIRQCKDLTDRISVIRHYLTEPISMFKDKVGPLSHRAIYIAAKRKILAVN